MLASNAVLVTSTRAAPLAALSVTYLASMKHVGIVSVRAFADTTMVQAQDCAVGHSSSLVRDNSTRIALGVLSSITHPSTQWVTVVTHTVFDERVRSAISNTLSTDASHFASVAAAGTRAVADTAGVVTSHTESFVIVMPRRTVEDTRAIKLNLSAAVAT
jgi:hypothetical protein